MQVPLVVYRTFPLAGELDPHDSSDIYKIQMSLWKIELSKTLGILDCEGRFLYRSIYDAFDGMQSIQSES